MELLDITGKVSTREKAIEIKGSIYCVTTTEIHQTDLICSEGDGTGDEDKKKAEEAK